MSFNCNIGLFERSTPHLSAFLPHVWADISFLASVGGNVFCQHLVHLKSILHLLGEPVLFYCMVFSARLEPFLHAPHFPYSAALQDRGRWSSGE
jgi:hypothetical protein